MKTGIAEILIMDTEIMQNRFEELTSVLLDWQNESGYWEGELSSSALGVAVSCAALHFYDKEANQTAIEKGMKWLSQTVNADGGFGDTPGSPSNISTSLLCFASVHLNRNFLTDSVHLQKMIAHYLSKNGIDVQSKNVAKSILDFYGKDYTFSVPILAMCALCGVPGKDAFEYIPQLPFEMALMPRRLLIGLSVVSYAIPALVAVGIAIFKHKKKKNFLMKRIRQASIRKALIELERMMPESGGFLEAIPLTAFVSMCLIESGYRDSAVVKNGIQFLQNTLRDDGGWPIDINLSVWVSSLAIKSLRSRLPDVLNEQKQKALSDYFLAIQNHEVHPFNGTTPGGWGWTNYSGSVPDGDDTPGVILALLELAKSGHISYSKQIESACGWLCKLQNRNGGFPTFTRGWGKLPFDQSCNDLTGHVVLAVSKAIDYFKNDFPVSEIKMYQKLVKKAVRFLSKNQNTDGSLLPLWFGNQHAKGNHNPVYGTARVITYLHDALVCKWISDDLKNEIEIIIEKGKNYLLMSQNENGSWGGDWGVIGSIEETSLALSAIIYTSEKQKIERGFSWLDQQFQLQGLKASPIGLYFASLWYSEKMYPLTAYLEAVCRMLEFAHHVDDVPVGAEIVAHEIGG